MAAVPAAPVPLPAAAPTRVYLADLQSLLDKAAGALRGTKPADAPRAHVALAPLLARARTELLASARTELLETGADDGDAGLYADALEALAQKLGEVYMLAALLGGAPGDASARRALLALAADAALTLGALGVAPCLAVLFDGGKIARLITAPLLRPLIVAAEASAPPPTRSAPPVVLGWNG
jgi:hypothetical protein